MNIVVLDGYTLNPGDLSWDELEKLGNCRIYDRTPIAETVERAGGAEILLTNKAPVRAETIAALPELKYIGVLATGFDVVDIEAARTRGIAVTNVPGYSTNSVAELVFALLLELARRAGYHGATVREGRWSHCPDFSYMDFPGIELNGLTVGIVGYGRIGAAVARIANGFGMKVLAHSRTQRPDEGGVAFVDLDTLLATSDVVSLHCPLTPQTRGLMDASRLSRMKQNAFLINTGRGPLVNEPDLADALNSGRIAGAGLDVLGTEPPAADNVLISAKNCLITPHIAWGSRAARERLMAGVVGNLRVYLAGESQNRVD